jgi:hypothetical protein
MQSVQLAQQPLIRMLGLPWSLSVQLVLRVFTNSHWPVSLPHRIVLWSLQDSLDARVDKAVSCFAVMNLELCYDLPNDLLVVQSLEFTGTSEGGNKVLAHLSAGFVVWF